MGETREVPACGGEDGAAQAVHVLVVEDDADVLALLATHLRRLGARVTLVGSGEEAMNRVEDDPPDVVIADILLPGLDGRQLYDALKAGPRTAGVPLIAATVLEKEDIGRHFDACISKPFDRAELERIVGPFVRTAGKEDKGQ